MTFCGETDDSAPNYGIRSVPTNLRRPLLTVGDSQPGSDLKVLTELVVGGRLANLRYSRLELIPVDIDRESVEKQVLGQQSVEGQRGDFLEHVCEGDPVGSPLLSVDQTR